MTIIGIAGCTALMVTGFGLQDSMSEIVHTQYDQIFKYDMKIELVEDKTDSTLQDFLDGKAHTKVSSQAAEASSAGGSEDQHHPLYTGESSGFLSIYSFASSREVIPPSPLIRMG